MAKWLKCLYEEYLQEELEEELSFNSSVVIGGLYFGSLKALDENKPNKPLYFLVIDKVDDDLYEVLKATDHYLFATASDVLIDLGTMKIAVETDNNFYLTEKEISKFKLIHQISEEELNKIVAFRDGQSAEIKKGFTPIFEDDIRRKFKREEFNQIKEFHSRIFEILEED
ncbi:MAG: hypothetical protein JHC31_00030 [Sulfurihydrogenibium sp.]|jgi:hypothetical protein|nr:hypothetical protein [Sulfurihydrogenibium sp.]